MVKATKVGVKVKSAPKFKEPETETFEKTTKEVAVENAKDNGASQNDEISSNKGSRKNI